jgi:hypothetical protein
VLAFGGIPTIGIRSSERIKKQPNADAMQLEQAQGLALQREQAMDSGNSHISRFSLSSILNVSIIDHASKLGVQLGSSPSQIHKSVNKLKEVDLQRMLVMLKRNEDKLKLVDDTISDSILQEALGLSLDLEEGEQQGSLDHEDQDLLNKKQKRRVKKLFLSSRLSQEARG